MAIFAIFGGSGFLGNRIVRRLKADGHEVRLVARHPGAARQEDDSPGKVIPIPADILRPETIRPALEGVDGAVNAVSLYLESGKTTFQAVHVEGAASLAEAAKAAGLKRFVHVSGIGADAASGDPFIKARGRGEASVLAACPFATIVRPSVMVGRDDAIRSTILGLTRMQPVFPLFGQGDTRLQPVHHEDVAHAIAKLLTMEEPAPLYEFGGPEVYTYAELVRRVAKAGGQPVWPVPVPFAIWEGLAALTEHLPGAPLTRSQVALMRKDNVAGAQLPGLPELGIDPTDIIADLRHETSRRQQA